MKKIDLEIPPGMLVIDDEGHTGLTYRDPWGQMKVKLDKPLGGLKAVHLTYDWHMNKQGEPK